ncbi:MAG: response regulator transcription factor, partial [Rhodospirillaceae bacterium]
SDLFIMVENAMALAVLIDAEDCPRWANARLLESTGYTRPELRRLTMDALVNKSGFASAPASAPFSEQRAAPEPVPAAAQAQTLGEGPPDPLGLGASSPPDPSALPSPFSPLQVLTRLREPISGAAWLGPWFTDGGTGEMRRLLLTFDPAALRAFRLLPTAQRPGAAPEELIGDFCQRVCHALALLGPEAPPGFDPTRRGSDSAGFDQGTKDRAKGAITRLPRRQREVLHLLAEGRSNKAIARMLGISEATVKTHVRVLCEKLGAENRTQAASLAAHLNR